IRASNSPQMNISISATTLDTGEALTLRGLLDCGCTTTSIDYLYVQRHWLTTIPVAQVRVIHNADGSVNGWIKEYVVLRIVIRDSTGKEHVEKRDFPVVNLG
ncbi:hypothetical protein EXIGLDRAFT_597772, partial [Exidia glandulosa HHB12029]